MFTAWTLAALLSKWISYLSMLAVPGGTLVLMLLPVAPRQTLPAIISRRILTHYLLPASLLGVLSSCVFFLTQIGEVNQRGFAGMFDRDMGLLLASTTLGDGVRWRLQGFVLAGLAACLWLYGLRASDAASARRLSLFALLPVILASLMFALSFTLLGHTVPLAAAARGAAVLHVLMISLWAGALLPLLTVLQHAQVDHQQAVAGVLRHYGNIGWGFISLMLLSGLFLIWQLLGSPVELVATAYGRLLLLKLVMVAGLMGLGAANKFRLVPALAGHVDDFQPIRQRLCATIRLEMLVVLVVLAVTAIFTTALGPPTE